MWRKLASDAQSRKTKAVFQQALRILGSDPASVGRLEQVLANDAHSVDSRRLAATALSHLSPESLNPVTLESVSLARGVGAKRATGAATPPKRKGALARHIETLRSIQR